MFKQRAFFVGASLVLVGCLLVPLSDSRAGDKKGEDKKGEKKGEPKKAEQIFSKSDELTSKDEKDTNVLVANSPRKVYKIKLMEGKTYQIDLKSKDFDAFLRLEDAAGKEIAFNNEALGEERLHARIVHKAAKTGEFKVVATSFDSKGGKLTGKFTLTVLEADAIAVVSVFKAKGIELKLKAGKARYEGALTDKDPVAFRPYKLFTVQLEEGKSYQIDHRSNGDDKKFDPNLFLEDADGIQLASDDDFNPPTLDARIVHKAAKTGVYRIIATTAAQTPTTGKFVLEISIPEATKKDAKAAKKDEKEQSRLDRSDSIQAAPALTRLKNRDE
jgi:hypothetical protein